MTPIRGTIGYHAGTSGTVTLTAHEKLIGLWCVATSGGATLTIDGGNSIPLVASIPFAMACESGDREWTGAISIVFSGTVSYFIKTRTGTA